MINRISINCDVGEGLNNEVQLMPYLTYCNIACGSHAGDLLTMKNTVKLAVEHGVKIGAHPSYPDKANFGRVSLKISKTNLKVSIQLQIENLKNTVDAASAALHHIKPHGALYNDIAKNEPLAETFLSSVEIYKNECKLMLPYGSVAAKMAVKNGFNVLLEAFADRNYNNDLSLVSRALPGALITEKAVMLAHVASIVNNQKVYTVQGEWKTLKADTFCVHADTPGAALLVKFLFESTREITDDGKV